MVNVIKIYYGLDRLVSASHILLEVVNQVYYRLMDIEMPYNVLPGKRNRLDPFEFGWPLTERVDLRLLVAKHLDVDQQADDALHRKNNVALLLVFQVLRVLADNVQLL